MLRAAKAQEAHRSQGFAHLPTNIRVELELTRRQADRLVEFADMKDRNGYEMKDDDLVDKLGNVELFEYLLLGSWVGTIGMLWFDSLLEDHGYFMWTLLVGWLGLVVLYPFVHLVRKHRKQLRDTIICLCPCLCKVIREPGDRYLQMSSVPQPTTQGLLVNLLDDDGLGDGCLSSVDDDNASQPSLYSSNRLPSSSKLKV